MIGESYGYRALAAATITPGGEVASGIPVVEVGAGPRKRWVSLPFTDYCQPLRGEGVDPDGYLNQMNWLRRRAGARRFEIRSVLPQPPARPGAACYVHSLALESNEQAVFARLHRNQVQRNIRRAEREGVRVRRGEVETDLTRVFYHLHVLTRRRLGVPVQPRRYFELLWRRILTEGMGFVLIAELGDAAVAAAVFLTFNGVTVYKYGASDDEQWKARANHLIFWEAIRWSCQNGYHTFDFGRTGMHDCGLREFKSRWGTTEQEMRYSVISDSATRPPRDELPHALRTFIRTSPPFVTRALGEALYRYTA
jgi:CelD/BcsL family acetyltransferase involved in cellulose biosynthesis